jgi:hypothetical protein
MPLRLHAVTAVDPANHHQLLLAGGARPIVFRDLAAIVTDRDKFALDQATDESTNAHRAIVDAAFKTQTVLPTPVGILFRADNVLTRWLELHYVTLTDALSFVHDRVAGRVHVSRKDADDDEKEAGTDLAEAATEIFRLLRRSAVASVPLTTEQITGIALSGAFLVERDRWAEFMRAAGEASKSNEHLAIHLTGPWAPYDFVRMQFDD